MFISCFSIIPDSAMKMYSNWLHQSVDLLHYIDTFMFLGFFTPFWITKQCYGLNHMSLLYYKNIYNWFHCTFMLLVGCCPVPAQMWKHLCACCFRVGKEMSFFLMQTLYMTVLTITLLRTLWWFALYVEVNSLCVRCLNVV